MLIFLHKFAKNFVGEHKFKFWKCNNIVFQGYVMSVVSTFLLFHNAVDILCFHFFVIQRYFTREKMPVSIRWSKIMLFFKLLQNMVESFSFSINKVFCFNEKAFFHTNDAFWFAWKSCLLKSFAFHWLRWKTKSSVLQKANVPNKTGKKAGFETSFLLLLLWVLLL